MKPDWGSLPSHLLSHVLSKVKTQQDYLEFDSVCASWHSVAMTRKQRSRINSLPRVPMLLVPSTENHAHSLYNVVTKSFSKSKLVIPYDRRFASFSRGWLVVVEKDFSVTLHKVTNNSNASTIIKLPILDHNYDSKADFDYKVKKAVITADPLTNPNECIVAIVYSGFSLIAFIRLNKDTYWTGIGTELRGFDDILYHSDQFYGLVCTGELYSFKVTEDPVNYLGDVKLVASHIPYPIFGKTYLVESQGMLLLVLRFLEYLDMESHHYTHRETSEVYVYELDVEKGEWFETNDLSDVALFLGDNSSISISCSDFPTCRSDCIYFTHDNDALGTTRYQITDFGEYDFESGMTLHFGMDTNTAMNIFPQIPIWVVPYAQ